ncbi:hypothetical protein MBLNU459_g6467t1 [Dothideomycetes sp. NU459]
MPHPTRVLRAAAAANKWGQTLHLPKSTFPARPSAAELNEYRTRCADELYAWQKEHRPATDDQGRDNTFVLHDGPPYANGAVHVGHALNKILKDLTVRSNLARGKRVQYTPGWDCHGLPIELKALQARRDPGRVEKQSGETASAAAALATDLGPAAVREAARELATKTVEEQKRAFRSWGVMGDWDKPYTTMDRDFELRQLGVFQEMVKKGLIYRQNKPVHWSPSSGTALAEAELEYDDNHRVVAAFIKFPVSKLPEILAASPAARPPDVSALIWTTTPWTLPANKAIAVRSDMDYVLVECVGDALSRDLQGQMVVARDRLESLKAHLPEGTSFNIIVDSIKGSQLENTEYTNILSGESGRIIHADFVTSESGTGLVHIAPGHGMDDYNVCMKLGIGPAFAPVDGHGRYTDKALPADPTKLQGLEVEKAGAKTVIGLLRYPALNLQSALFSPDTSLVLATHNFRHKNPIDWRTKLPVIVRATEQWFADVGSIKDQALASLDSVKFIPESGRSRLQSFLQGRTQWCVSRQRSWGVPIPALFHKETGEAVMTSDVIAHIISVVRERGTDAWWTDAEEDPAWLAPGLEPGLFVRGKDTMDVWFDSGTAWTSLAGRSDGSVADVFLEGTDQHRGWFQSSLLTYVSHQDKHATASAPFKTLITHGFTLDLEGRKMSKSLGNVISPEEILSGSLLPPVKVKNDKAKGARAALRPNTKKSDAMGPDVLRLWVASSDYTKDVVIGQPILQAVHQSLQKYRVTFKWLLGILHEYPAAGPVEELLDEISFSDQITLHRLSQTSHAVWDAYGSGEFYKGVVALNKFINADLSAFYFEVIKDRLYADDELVRQHTQTVLFHILDELLHMLTPICPHLVEEVWAHLPPHMQQDPNRPHPLHRIWDAPFSPEFDVLGGPGEMDAMIAAFAPASAAVKAAQEAARRAGALGSGLACRVELLLPRETAQAPLTLLMDLRDKDELAELFVVSDVDVLPLDPAYRARLRELDDPAVDAELQAAIAARDNPEWKFEVEFDCGTAELPAKAKAVVCPPLGHKCVRCWQYIADEPDALCGRCVGVVGELEHEEGGEGEDDGLPRDFDKFK